MNFMTRLEEIVFPATCIKCQTPTSISSTLCQTCWSKIHWITSNACPICAHPRQFPEEGSFCGFCYDKAYNWDQAIACFLYSESSKDLILKFKHGNKPFLAKSLASFLSTRLIQFAPEIDYVCPVPLHWTRYMKRHYNQAELLSRYVARTLSCPHEPHLLKRHKRTAPQGNFSAKERDQNVKNAFQVSPKFQNHLKGKTILLIDDVRTSGATFNQCCAILKSYQVKKIIVASIALVAF